MYLKNEDLDFLIELENKLWATEGFTDDVEKLWKLNERLIQKRNQTREKTLNYITEKRKSNPNYGRSKEEIQAREKAKEKRNKQEN